MYKDETLAVVVPAYNEAGFVGEVIEGLPEYVDRAYVVDDGSTDDTWSEIERHAERRNDGHSGLFDDQIVPIRHERNRGVGGAIKTGYLRSREEGIAVTVVMGGDGQMNPNDLPAYLDPIVDGTVGYTKGNRFSTPSDWAEMPRFRFVGNVVLSYLTKIASGYWGVMDSQNGFTAISLDALQRTDIEDMYEYYGYCNDLLVRLNEANVRVADVPSSSAYVYEDGWKSHIDYTEYVPRVSWMLFRGFLRRLVREHLLYRYDPVAPLYLLSIGTVGTGIAGTLASLRSRGRDGLPTWFIATLIGVLSFVYATSIDAETGRSLSTLVNPDSRPRVGRSDDRDDEPRGDETEMPLATGVEAGRGDGS